MDLAGRYSLDVVLKTSTGRYTNSTAIKVSVVDQMMVVQTDKAIYKPSQTVRVRVFAMNPNLTPAVCNVSAVIFVSFLGHIQW